MNAFVSPEKYLVMHILRDYITPDSVVFSFAIPKNGYCYELPKAAQEFLLIDEPDDD